MKRQLIYIEWEDHVGYNGSWTSFSEVDNKPIIIKSVGWLLKEDKKSLTISSCIDTQDFKQGKCISTILKNCIVRRKKLGVS